MSKLLIAVLVVFAAVVVYFVVQELQIETRRFSLSVEIRGLSREDIFASLADPHFISSLHPLADDPAVTDFKKGKNDVGNDQITYLYHEVIPMFGIYKRKVTLPIIVTVMEPDSMVQYNGSLDNDLITVSQHWKLTDIADGSVEATDNLAITSYRILTRHAISVALEVHSVILKNLKKKLEQ